MIDDHHQKTALDIVLALTVLGGIAVLLRIWSRWLSRSAITSDDCMIVAGYIISVCQSVTTWYLIQTNYVGIHAWEVPKDRDAKIGGIWEFANQLLYNPALTIVKISILLFLRRLESRSRVVNTLIWSSLAVILTLFVSVLIVDICQCNPVRYFYDKNISGQCINQPAFYISTAALNLLTDVMVLSIPIIITARLHMPLRRKIAVCIILCLGIVATGVGVWRIVTIAQAYKIRTHNPDPTYDIGICSSAVEVNVAVVTACAPSMKAISSRFLPRLLGSRGGDISSYGAGATSGTGLGSRKTRLSHIFKKHPSNIQSAYETRGGDAYEMADPPGGSQVNVGVSDAGLDMRKYKQGDNLSDLTLSDDGNTGIMRTTDISVGYSMGPATEDGRSREGRPASVDSIV